MLDGGAKVKYIVACTLILNTNNRFALFLKKKNVEEHMLHSPI